MEVTLLSKKEVEGKSKILAKVGRGCYDFYWTRTLAQFNRYGNASEIHVTPTGDTCYCTPVNVNVGVRPVLKSDNLEELIKNLKITYENGVEVVEYGQYPDLKAQLDIPNNARLKPTGKKYYYRHSKKHELQERLEYKYNGEKIVNIEDEYYKVKPVKFYVDRKNSMLISKYVLFDAPINLDTKNYNGDFTTSQLYQFLNNEFIKALKPDKKYTNDDIETFDSIMKNWTDEENPYNLNLGDVAEEDIIEGAILSDIPLMLHGLTAAGKSSRIKQMDKDVQIVYLGLANPTDINGKSVQKESLDHLIDYPPTWYVKAKEIAEANPDKIHIVFFDEITNADPLIQGMVFNIILNKEVNGKWKLPENVRIVAAGNEEEESLSAHELSVPLFSRFAHVYIETNREKWLKWASKAVDEEGNPIIHPAIYAYIAYKGDEVLRTEYNGKTPNADPRKWEMASRILYKVGKPDMLRALIGKELTYDFKNFITQRIITLEDVLNDNYKDINMDISSKYACIANLTMVDEENVQKVREFVSKLGPEFLSTFDSMWTIGSEERLEIIASLRIGEKQI